jgi:hypothetical protein
MEIRVAHEQFPAVLDQHFLKNLDQLREKRVCKVGDDDSVDVALAILEVNRAGIGNKVQVIYDFLNAEGCFLRDQLGSVDDA